MKRPVVAGVDEAGRGPLAGPVVGAAVVLTASQMKILRSEGLADSKKMTPRCRERVFEKMKDLGVLWKARAVSHRRIDRINILRASLEAMSCSLLALPVAVDLVVVDGTIPLPCPCAQKTLAKADAKVPAVQAASVVAKVLRDRVMTALDRLYPEYGFAGHKGYPTLLHRRTLAMLGPCPVHRLSFAGVCVSRGGK